MSMTFWLCVSVSAYQLDWYHYLLYTHLFTNHKNEMSVDRDGAKLKHTHVNQTVLFSFSLNQIQSYEMR